jgi:thiol-disulfide isomerase/thioredoxin
VASGGVDFERAFAHNPTTLASHTNILTGTTPLYHGVGDNNGWLYRIEGRKDVWGKGAIIVELINPEHNLRFSKANFTLDLPEGFEPKEYSGNYPPIGEPAPEWTLSTYSGDTISLKDLKGNVVVMDFWATWCGPCAQSIPQMQKLHEKYKDRHVKIVGLTYLEKNDPVAFMKKLGATYPIMKGDPIAKDYNPNLPMVIVIDPEEKVVEIFNGYFGRESDERLERTILSVLEQAGL